MDEPGAPPDNVLPFRARRACLECTAADGTTTSIPLSDHVRIGRHRDNELRLDEQDVSNFHCHIERRADGYVLVDDDSRNGVFVNGVRLDAFEGHLAPLRDGDAIVVGDTLLVVRLSAVAAP